MHIDGNAIAADIQNILIQTVLERGGQYSLAVVCVGDNAVSDTFIEQKQRFGSAIGVAVSVVRLSNEATSEEVKQTINDIAGDSSVTGIVVQLPLPKQLPVQEILDTVPVAKDVDVLSSAARERFQNKLSSIIPPVAGAFEEIVTRYAVDLQTKNIVVLGKGILVGQPVATWLTIHGYTYTSLDKHSQNIEEALQNADVIISGIGSSHYIQPTIIKDGVIIIDAGTSGQSGKTAGDADPQCAEKASLFTPVPGGVGPITVARLFKNVVAQK